MVKLFAVTMSDYAGQNPPNIDFTGVARLGLTGAAMGKTLHYGHEAGALTVTGNPLTSFSAFLRPNLDARSASGSLDWTAKAYVQASAPGGVSLGAGDIFGFYNRHVISVA